jgi:macrolide transport system ATP-binding/permease protein
MIEIRNLEKVYHAGEQPLKVLKGVSLEIEDGDFVAIMGPSGSGKSTLMNILGLLDVPSAGSYLFNDREVAQLSEDELAILRREEIGFVFQQFNLLNRLTAAENVVLPLYYTQSTVDLKIGEDLLAEMGLAERTEHKPKELSGGQQQRVAIARALVNRPRMILADEPTGNLDSASEKQIMEILRRLNERGITVVIVTHEEEIGRQAKRLIRMRDGLVQSDERREDFAKKPLPVGREITKSYSGVHWSEIKDHFRQGYQTLIANKARSSLSMLGVMIGVAAVMAMLAIGRGAEQEIQKQLASMGSNILLLKQGSVRSDGGVKQPPGSVTRLTLGDALAIREKIPHVTRVGAWVWGWIQATYGNRNWSTSILGVTADYAMMHASEPDIGRFFTSEENAKRLRLAVIGMTVVRELFGDRNPIGEMIKINKIPFQVIGVLPEKGGFNDQDDQILVPILTAMHRLLGRDYVETIEIEIDAQENMDAVQTAATDILSSRHRIPPSQRQEAFQIRNMAEVQAALSQSGQTMSVLLASIAAISLLVGGIGIMNIMLVSVTERTKEIGLRKAVGARRRDILLQFLSESVVVSAIGGLAGIALGWLITVMLTLFAGWATSISATSVILSVLFSTIIGIAFGVYPARKASEMLPIEALRYE